jgi:biotin carboxylase
VNEARRNKYLTNQMVQDAGLDTVKQKSCKSLKEAEEFATTLGLEDGAENASTMVVVKPLRGVASDDVHLCSDMASLRAAFNKIYQSAVFGSATSSKHENVLVQEFATGTEYAIDVVCKDGERKVAALWKYDKRAVNDAPFVYFSTQLVAAVGEDVEQAVCEYVFNALDALGIRWGLHHVEVIVEKTSTDTIRVRLVEVNCRQHNTDFRPLTNAVVGYNALDMTLTAYLGDGSDSQQNKHQYPLETEHLRLKWNTLPTLPSTLAYGAIVHFVSFVEGTISRIRFDILNEMEELDSVMDMEVYPQFLEVGNEIEKTKDIRTDTGWAHIMNDDKIKFQADYQRLVELMAEMFEVE